MARRKTTIRYLRRRSSRVASVGYAGNRQDRHLRTNYGAIGPMGPASPSERERMRPDRQLMDKSRNFGFESVQRLAGNVGYVDLRNFLDVRDAGETTDAAMTFLSNKQLEKEAGGKVPDTASN